MVCGHLTQGVAMRNDRPEFIDHLPHRLLAAYAAGSCDAVTRFKIEEHCLQCEECQARLTVLLRICQMPTDEEQRIGHKLHNELEALVKSMQEARRPRVKTADEGIPSVKKSWFWRISRLGKNSSHLIIALIIVALVISSGVWAFLAYRASHGPEAEGRKALYKSYRGIRPLEARVTGGFDYLPYERKRGMPGGAQIDHSQFDLALSELTRAVASNPTPEARHALGQLNLLIGNFERAEEQLMRALNDAPKNARLHADLGTLYFVRSRKADPLPLLSKAIDYYSSAIELEPGLVEAWFNRALSREEMALYTEAEADWEHYLQLDSGSPWADEARDHLKKLKSRAGTASELDKSAQAEFRAAVDAGNEQAMRQLVTERYFAVYQLATGALLDEYLQRSLAGETAEAATCLKTLVHTGQLAFDIKGDRFIVDCVDSASRASPGAKRVLREVRLMLRQADLERDRGALDAAFNLYSRAYRAAERIRDQCHAEMAAFRLVHYYSFRADFKRLTNASTPLVANIEHRHHRQLEAQTLLALTNAYISSLQTSNALDLSLRAAELAKGFSDADTAITGLLFAGVAYLHMGNHEQAVKKNFEAITLMRAYRLPPRRSVVAYTQMGESLLAFGNHQRALDYHLESLRVAKQLNNPAILAALTGRLGLNYWKLGRNEDATHYLTDAVERTKAIEDHTARLLLQVELYTALGDFHLSRGNADGALDAYQQVIKTVGKTNHRIHLSGAHQGLAAAYLAQGKVAEAETQLRTSIMYAERDRRQINDAQGRSIFLASRQNVYRAMMEFQAFTKNDSVQAFNYAEVSKSRDLLDLLGGQTGLRKSDGQVTIAISGSAPPLTLKQVQRALPSNAQLVEYAIASDRVVILFVTNDRIVPESTGVSMEALHRLVTSYVDGVTERRDLNEVNRQAAELYRMLISPVAAHLDPKRTLCIITDGILSQLPFAALRSPETQHYLIEDFSLVVNPSASILVKSMGLTRAKGQSTIEKFFGLSNPRFNHQKFPDLPDLPSADKEVASAQSCYSQAQTLSREQATESALIRQMGGSEIIHLATHVIINEHSPLLSSIILAEESDQTEGKTPRGSIILDGKLQAQEIYQLKLPQTRLVILSGCQSARGTYKRGEALSGLAQAFLTAGVPAIIASLSDVDDESTAELMRSFHFEHRVNQRCFSEALSHAQRSLIHGADSKRQHPYYWATFLLAGNGCQIAP